jgi:hypothetical protein
MGTVYFPSDAGAEVIDVEFVTSSGASRSLRLLVDSGFTGKSSLVLDRNGTDLVWASVPPAIASGALQGQQNRAWVTCRIPGLSFEFAVVAILGEVSLLSLPPGVDGMAGLRFLRHFTRWGAERTNGSRWQFYLSSGGD